MNVQKTLCFALVIGFFGLSAAARAESTDPPGLLAGKVHSSSAPLSSVGVYAYQLADLSLKKVTTDKEGSFLFRELPAGLYKIIAHKGGFLPAVVTLARSSADVDQFVDLELVSEGTAASEGTADFWSVRKKIPTDVLREMGLAAPQLADRGQGPGEQAVRHLESSIAGFQTKMQAMAGIHQGADQAESQMSGGRLELDGQLGSARVAFDGYYLKMDPASQRGAVAGQSGHQSALTLNVSGGGNSQVSVASRSSRLSALEVADSEDPMDFEQLAVTWRTPLGNKGESQITAQYTEESNFYSSGWIEPAEIPDASKTLNIQGSYSTTIGAESTFQTLLRYRERERSFLSKASPFAASLDSDGRFAEESLELTGRGGWRLQPTVLVEYGLTSRLHDGSLSFTPHGGLVFQVGDLWQAAAEASHRVEFDEETLFQDFVPALFHEAGACDQAEAACYRVSIQRTSADEDSRLSFGAAQKEYGETLRVFFSEDFFNHLESLFLVRGDRLPELQFAFSHRIKPSVLTTLESNLASGGGGLVLSPADEPFENQLQYLVTTLDTQFQTTSTGVLLAFHHLRQQLRPTSEHQPSRPEMQVDRLQVRVTQDLGFLMDLASDWAVHLNMELSRGSAFLGENAFDGDDELRQRFLGGLAVRF